MARDPAETVREQLEARKQRALETAARRQQEAYERCPQIHKVNSRMAQVAMEIASAAMSENGPAVIETIKEKILGLQQEKAALLEGIGMTPSDLLPPYTCPRCQDTGYASGKRCGCWDLLYCQEARKRLPPAAVNGQCSFGSFRTDYYPQKDERGEDARRTMERIVSLCRDYAEQVGGDDTGNLLFLGKTGLGKTHLSLAIAGRAAERGLLVKYASAQGIIDRFERTRFNRTPSAEDWDFVSAAGEARLLIIDDLGSEFVTSFSQSVLYNIINDRMMSNRSTIISTNLDPARLTATYEQRISSRILCGYTALAFTGKDIRLLQKLQAR